MYSPRSERTIVADNMLAAKVIVGWWAYAQASGFEPETIIGPRSSRGHLHTANAVLASSWFSSSFIFLLFCHVGLTGFVAIAKESGKGFSDPDLKR